MASRRVKLAGVVSLVVLVALGAGAWKARRLIDAIAEVLASDELDGKQLTTADDVWAYLRAHPTRWLPGTWETKRTASSSMPILHGRSRRR